jgi:hypothetical protein
MPHPTDDQRTPRSIANDEDLLEAAIDARMREFMGSLTPEQRKAWVELSDLESDQRGQMQDLTLEGVIAHFGDAGRLFRLIWRHCANAPADAVHSCCRSWGRS